MAIGLLIGILFGGLVVPIAFAVLDGRYFDELGWWQNVVIFGAIGALIGALAG